ncbi:MAG TPA: FGGY family carbohydrate kinase, partial [Spirochaetia bacterium]|nr:FGGY family carbohydrate kinase [Spirochaetia bacterium]
MKHRFLLGLDAGSSGVHCLLADADDRRSVSSFQAWFHPVDRNADVWGFQFDTVYNWRILARAVQDVIERAGAKPSEVIGLAAAGMRFGLVVLDKKGREIFATPNRDARAASQSSELAREHGTDIQRLSGHWPGPIFAAPRLRWLSARQPDLLKRADKVLNVSDWVAFRLCGEAVMDHSQASETLLADLGTSDWASDMIDAFDLPRDIFLRVRPPGTHLGALTREAASELGLKAGTPVAVGGADTQCSLLGGGVISHGQVGIVAGTTVPIQLVLDTPLIDATAHLWTGRHVIDKAWVLESNAGAMGEALEWISEALFS